MPLSVNDMIKNSFSIFRGEIGRKKNQIKKYFIVS